jgi:predicted porin
MKLRKTQLAAAVGAALAIGGTAAQAQTVTPSQTQVGVQLYGQVNRALMYADNETSNKVFHVDGQPSSTRFGIQGTGQVMPGLRAGARIETEIRSNRSNEVTFAVPSTPSQTFTERWMDIFFQGDWGMVNIGQGSGAADGANEVNLHGVGIVLSNPMNDFGGAIPFTNSAGASVTTPDSVSSNLDHESRHDRVMYTTPVFGGLKAQVGFGQTGGGAETTEASLWYSGKLAGEFQAALGWSKANTGPDPRETLGVSAAWLHGSGINFAVTWAERELGTGFNRDATYMSAAVGYKFGPHAIALKYEMTEDLQATGDEATGMGIGYVWTAARWAEIYAGYMMYELDRTGVALNDITVAMVGTRIRF